MLEILIVLHLFLKRLFSYFCLLLATACSTEEGISPFSSDGCSLFPNSSLISEDDWCECCFQHDLSYWRGGSEQERLVADQRLKQCVFEATHDHVLQISCFKASGSGVVLIFITGTVGGMVGSMNENTRHLVKMKLSKQICSLRNTIHQFSILLATSHKN